ncbi:MAG TPA: type IV toxin-antitoxin system AbiEi family antitoxin domain-containing protein [Actinomycetota bacterium]|nr:type IV toxin-antitoxin system AbiEi family antitoxin domain-containing protein [Actinomycetota bacterium]
MKTSHNDPSASTKLREQRLRHLVAFQFGAIGRQQALAEGLGPDAIKYRVRSGEWRRVLPGVFIVNSVLPSWNQKLKAAELWACGDAVVSHRAGAAVWELDGIEHPPVELLTTKGSHLVPKGIILHRTKVLARRDWAEYGGFRVTGLARTLFDLAGVVDPGTFEAAAESALRRNRNLYGDLVARLDELGTQGRNGIAVVREFLAARDPDAAPTESVLETRFLRLARAAGLPELVRQYVVRAPSGSPVGGDRFITRLDFADADPEGTRFGIRLNGKATHLVPEQWQKDQTQGNDLEVLGWTVLDFTWEDVVDRPDYVIAMMQRGYARAISTSTTSPLGSRQSAL